MWAGPPLQAREVPTGHCQDGICAQQKMGAQPLQTAELRGAGTRNGWSPGSWSQRAEQEVTEARVPGLPAPQPPAGHSQSRTTTLGPAAEGRARPLCAGLDRSLHMHASGSALESGHASVPALPTCKVRSRDGKHARSEGLMGQRWQHSLDQCEPEHGGFPESCSGTPRTPSPAWGVGKDGHFR